jgi:hypothetical protein
MLEFQIKELEINHDLSRSAVFARAVKAAEHVPDWNEIQVLLSEVKRIDQAPLFANYQCKYDGETAEILTRVKQKMLLDLKHTGLKVLQLQFVVLLLYTNYLEELKKQKIALKGEAIDDINLPDMAKILVEMMLLDKDGECLESIRNIMLYWKNKKLFTERDL